VDGVAEATQGEVVMLLVVRRMAMSLPGEGGRDVKMRGPAKWGASAFLFVRSND